MTIKKARIEHSIKAHRKNNEITGSAIIIILFIAGILILVGLLVVQGTLGWILAIVGLVPLLAGLFDRCIFAPLFSLPFAGPGLRQAVKDGDQ